MLATLIRATGIGELQFVGGTGQSNGTASATPTFSLTSLTGGLDSQPAIGDIVIAAIAYKNNSDDNITCTTAGYTEITDLYSNQGGDTDEINFAAYRSTLTTADTTISFSIDAQPSYFVCHVWRSISATPLDATSTTSVGELVPPNPPSITTVTENAVVIAIGASAADVGKTITQPTVPTGMENLFQTFNSTDGGIAIASITRPTIGSYNPSSFGGFSTGLTNGTAAVTIALRPA